MKKMTKMMKMMKMTKMMKEPDDDAPLKMNSTMKKTNSKKSLPQYPAAAADAVLSADEELCFRRTCPQQHLCLMLLTMKHCQKWMTRLQMQRKPQLTAVQLPEPPPVAARLLPGLLPRGRPAAVLQVLPPQPPVFQPPALRVSSAAAFA